MCIFFGSSCFSNSLLLLIVALKSPSAFHEQKKSLDRAKVTLGRHLIGWMGKWCYLVLQRAR